MRAAEKSLFLGLLGLTVFALAFGLRRIFLWDVMPLAWDQSPPRAGTLEAAFLLLTLENLGAVVAVVALAAALWMWFSRQRDRRV